MFGADRPDLVTGSCVKVVTGIHTAIVNALRVSHGSGIESNRMICPGQQMTSIVSILAWNFAQNRCTTHARVSPKLALTSDNSGGDVLSG